MANITINGKEYDLDKLSDTAKGHLASLRVADQKMNQLQAEMAIAQTARNSYARVLQKELDEMEPESKSEEESEEKSE